jgi:hypothetical protein
MQSSPFFLPWDGTCIHPWLSRAPTTRSLIQDRSIPAGVTAEKTVLRSSGTCERGGWRNIVPIKHQTWPLHNQHLKTEHTLQKLVVRNRSSDRQKHGPTRVVHQPCMRARNHSISRQGSLSPDLSPHLSDHLSHLMFSANLRMSIVVDNCTQDQWLPRGTISSVS